MIDAGRFFNAIQAKAMQYANGDLSNILRALCFVLDFSYQVDQDIDCRR